MHVYAMYPNNYAHDSRFVVFSCGLVMLEYHVNLPWTDDRTKTKHNDTKAYFEKYSQWEEGDVNEDDACKPARFIGWLHDDVIKWKDFPRWPYVRGIYRSPVDSPHKGQRHEALMFLWSAPEPSIEQTIETPVIWDAIALITASL